MMALKLLIRFHYLRSKLSLNHAMTWSKVKVSRQLLAQLDWNGLAAVAMDVLEIGGKILISTFTLFISTLTWLKVEADMIHSQLSLQIGVWISQLWLENPLLGLTNVWKVVWLYRTSSIWLIKMDGSVSCPTLTTVEENTVTIGTLTLLYVAKTTGTLAILGMELQIVSCLNEIQT